MISKSQIKLITSLHQKKYRNKTGLFLAEGPKIIHNLIRAGVKVHQFYSSEDASHIFPDYEEVTPIELQKISALKTANTMLAVFKMPNTLLQETAKPVLKQGLIVALDAVRDPGNLGTIIRLCDWFGIEDLLCSLDTVDCYNPKVIQATMGSIAKVKIHYTEISEYLKNQTLPIYAAVMDGRSIYTESLPNHAILVMGNEANGISKEVENLIEKKLTIPQFRQSETAESLNVATATGILLNEFRRITGK